MIIINDPATLAEVTKVFRCYEKALMDNDVNILNELFWSNSSVVRYGLGENSYGLDEISSLRARRNAKLRQLQRTLITTFGRNFATANTEFERIESGRQGRQSQTWLRMDEGWRIVSAHVSWFDPNG